MRRVGRCSVERQTNEAVGCFTPDWRISSRDNSSLRGRMQGEFEDRLGSRAAAGSDPDAANLSISKPRMDRAYRERCWRRSWKEARNK